MALALTLGLLTPPTGMVLYALVRVTGLGYDQLDRIATPYTLMLIAIVVVLIVFPELTLFLPRLLGFKAAS
jgi:TRAP-type C4-dicarboxylate transport system permease large subunit